MIDSRDILNLKPYVAYLCNRLIEECNKLGIKLLVTSTLRDAEFQRHLYEQGRTRPGVKVTSTPLIGAHGFGLAFDIVPLDEKDEADWDSIHWNTIGKIGKSLGLEWAGDWTKFIEKCHFQYTKGLSNEELRAGKLPSLPPVPSIQDGGINLMDYKLKPIAKGKLKGTGSLDCCSSPSNNARTGVKLLTKHEPFNIFAVAENEGRLWYLVNATTEQWVAAGFVEITLSK